MSGEASGRAAISAVFDASNLYLGNFIGEFVGEMATAAWFLALSVAYRRDARPVVAWLAMGAGLVERALRELGRSASPDDLLLLERLLDGTHSQKDLEAFTDLIERISKPTSLKD